MKDSKKPKPLARPCLTNDLLLLLMEVPRFSYRKFEVFNLKLDMKSYSMKYEKIDGVQYILIKPYRDYFRDGSFGLGVPKTIKFTCPQKAFEYLTG